MKDEYEEMFERIDREADGEVYVNEVLDFLQSMASDLDQVRFTLTTTAAMTGKLGRFGYISLLFNLQLLSQFLTKSSMKGQF